MDFFQVIKKRRSVRKFLKVDIPKEHLLKILEAGRLAPSGRNIQPWEFIVIDDEKIIQQLAEIQPCLGEVKLLIGVIVDPGMSKYWLEDGSAVIENMLLAITALGYASCWIEGTLLKKEEWAKSLLKIPKEKKFLALLPVGKKSEEVSKPYKKPLSNLTWHNSYGNPYPFST